MDRRWPEIEAFIDTGHSNAKSKGVHRVIKLVARNPSASVTPTTSAYGYAASPHAEPERTFVPLNFEDPAVHSAVRRGVSRGCCPTERCRCS
ncbi:hypothetical protein ACFZDK_54125 [Streptomyces sp. NPDC007901]|uniref:hypothetical protein n=1 Tax=Streptomyces sp. NPDC007901 TaxID=3364785 RepID=UPI0036E6D247